MKFPDLSAAACIGTDPEAFYPDDSQQVPALVRRICASCPVQAECLEWGLHHEGGSNGVWGGLSGRERKALRRSRGISLESSTTDPWTRMLDGARR